MKISQYLFIPFFMLVSMAASAQKKKNREIAPPPPKKVEYAPPTPKKPESFITEMDGNTAFRWKNEPETLTTFTPDDLVERIYDFSGMYAVRIISNYPLETVSFKKPDKDDDRIILLGYTVKYDDYDTIELKGNKMTISDKKDPKKEKITLDVTKKGNKIIRIKEVKTGRVFDQSEYSPSPSI
ncbi:hypothetical protein [Chryseobacterium sp. BIGb0232]|uniref:hypothetical protein n=1 Tax=Chryseobacterium sp. BIGb0232 TaxID=2940598 RepID=UPI000FABB0FA|nr:hypothetical protein [Chryseobacterium sp. BIGb0232]MCS4304177.1 hypothetical protein [Chryseobacterium sp. BIGb0232]ROS17756.1 hypothetical protein EDF65_2137 [Chryseobacterium nakagawai]